MRGSALSGIARVAASLQRLKSSFGTLQTPIPGRSADSGPLNHQEMDGTMTNPAISSRKLQSAAHGGGVRGDAVVARSSSFEGVARQNLRGQCTTVILRAGGSAARVPAAGGSAGQEGRRRSGCAELAGEA
jgi:hypothetical protein